ncbi:hypothetical protein [Streptomyces sp. NPDC056296]|uniref:hypothetical protein n=1 Tax=Streptomyces sp. NPDC056296 TaxID=3345775 RepID=UPI0035DF6A09
MTALVHETVVPLGVTESRNDPETMGRVSFGLRRQLVADVVTDAMYDDLESVLGDHGAPRSLETVESIAGRFRSVAPTLEDLITRLNRNGQPLPEQMQTVLRLSAEEPAERDARAQLVRFGLAILDVLDDVLGDLAS